MPSNAQTTAGSAKRPWAGLIISAIPILFLLMDGVMKFAGSFLLGAAVLGVVGWGSVMGVKLFRDARERGDLTNAVKSVVPELHRLKIKAMDAAELAKSTPRIALNGPVANLQSIKRELEAV